MPDDERPTTLGGEFISLAKNSVTTSETPVPPNSCAETVTYLQRAYAD
jgi:hypothetical protein